jgi:N-acetylmuramoyl-L-alanine amidase
VKYRRIRTSLAFLFLLLPVLVAAQGERPQTPPVVPGTGARAAVTLEGRELPVPVTINPSGPMFGLTPLVDALGGKLTGDETAESFTLRLAEKDVVLGTGNAIITVGDAIISLSQPPALGDSGVQVPVDFLRKTYGDLLGYAFEWHPETMRLTIARRGNRQMGVALDVVHLQELTTVVLQFSEEPRYQISRQQPGTIVVEMLADRLAPPVPPKTVQDPLVQGVTIEPQQIRIQLAQGVQAESYILQNPFRLVFDVHPTSAVEVPTGPPVPAGEAAGVHTIVIDPGHGGSETGAISPNGVPEKELTMQLARELEAKLAQRLAVRVVLTRNGDEGLRLDDRTAIANQNKADLFVSIHLNSSLGSGAYGTETYFLSPQATDTRAARAAAAENAGAEGTAGAGDAAEQQDLQLILWDLAQAHHMVESQRFANMIQGELNQTLQLKDRGVKQAPFRVLMGAMMPAVLVELGFLSNPEEEKKLQDPAYRDQLVDALARAIGRYKALVENLPEPAAGAAPQPPAPQGQPAAPPAPAKPPAKMGRSA